MDDKKTGWKETKYRPNVENAHEKRWFGRPDIIPWPRLFRVHSKRMSNKQRCCRQKQKYVGIQDFCWGFGESFLILRNLAQTFPYGSMTWKVMQRNVWSDIASWRTKRLNSCTKSVTPKPRTNMLKECRSLSKWGMWITYQPTHILLKGCLSWTSLKSMKQWSKWSLRAEILRWDTCQEPSDLPLIGHSTESIWAQRSKSNLFTSKKQLADMLTK